MQGGAGNVSSSGCGRENCCHLENVLSRGRSSADAGLVTDCGPGRVTVWVTSETFSSRGRLERGEKQNPGAEGNGLPQPGSPPDQCRNSVVSGSIWTGVLSPKDGRRSKQPANYSAFGGKREAQIHQNCVGLLFKCEGI